MNGQDDRSLDHSRAEPVHRRVGSAGSESSLDSLGICRRELVFERQGLVRPGGKRLRINELLQLTDQPVSKIFRSVRRQTRWLGPFRTRSPAGRRRPPGFELDCRLV
jgi:hypothetical protein